MGTRLGTWKTPTRNLCESFKIEVHSSSQTEPLPTFTSFYCTGNIQLKIHSDKIQNNAKNIRHLSQIEDTTPAPQFHLKQNNEERPVTTMNEYG